MSKPILIKAEPNLSESAVLDLCVSIIGRYPIHFGTDKAEIGVNHIGGGRKAYRSDTCSSINWHSEGYDQSEQCIDFICLYCYEKAESGGATLVSNGVVALQSLSYEDCDFRYRKNKGAWSPWRPVLKENRIRLSMKDKAKDIQLSRASASVNLLQKQLDSARAEFVLEQGNLLIIDNTEYLHAREAFDGKRHLLRLVF